jgi:hypothetical protein
VAAYFVICESQIGNLPPSQIESFAVADFRYPIYKVAVAAFSGVTRKSQIANHKSQITNPQDRLAASTTHEVD